MRTLLLVFASSLLCLASSPADGEWSWKMASPFGELNARAVMKVEDGKLTGAFYLDDSRKREIVDGKADGEMLIFTLSRTRPSGGSMTYEMTGTIKGDSIEGSAKALEMGATQNWSAARKK